MSFYSNFLSMCNKIGKTPSRVVLEVGLKKSAVTRWKAGGNPTDATIQKIADYFGISASELMDKEENTPTKDGEREISFDDFTYAMQNEYKNLTSEDLQVLRSMAKQLDDARKMKNGESG